MLLFTVASASAEATGVLAPTDSSDHASIGPMKFLHEPIPLAEIDG
jgi:hypothetical protein